MGSIVVFAHLWTICLGAAARRGVSSRRRDAADGAWFVRIHEIEGSERRRDRVPHALGGPPADGETGLNVVQRQSAGRPLEAHRESHEVLYPLVTHCAACVII